MPVNGSVHFRPPNGVGKGLLPLKWIDLQILSKTIIYLYCPCLFDDSYDFDNIYEIWFDNLENKYVQVFMHISQVLCR